MEPWEVALPLRPSTPTPTHSLPPPGTRHLHPPTNPLATLAPFALGLAKPSRDVRRPAGREQSSPAPHATSRDCSPDTTPLPGDHRRAAACCECVGGPDYVNFPGRPRSSCSRGPDLRRRSSRRRSVPNLDLFRCCAASGPRNWIPMPGLMLSCLRGGLTQMPVPRHRSAGRARWQEVQVQQGAGRMGIDVLDENPMADRS